MSEKSAMTHVEFERQGPVNISGMSGGSGWVDAIYPTLLFESGFKACVKDPYILWAIPIT